MRAARLLRLRRLRVAGGKAVRAPNLRTGFLCASSDAAPDDMKGGGSVAKPGRGQAGFRRPRSTAGEQAAVGHASRQDKASSAALYAEHFSAFVRREVRPQWGPSTRPRVHFARESSDRPGSWWEAMVGGGILPAHEREVGQRGTLVTRAQRQAVSLDPHVAGTRRSKEVRGPLGKARGGTRI